MRQDLILEFVRDATLRNFAIFVVFVKFAIIVKFANLSRALHELS